MRVPARLFLLWLFLLLVPAFAQPPTQAPTSARDPVADVEKHEILFSGGVFTQTDTVQKYHKHYYVLDAFALGTECRIVHDECGPSQVLPAATVVLWSLRGPVCYCYPPTHLTSPPTTRAR